MKKQAQAQQVKTQAPAVKAAPKQAPKARQQKTLAYAAILAEALAGKFGDRVKAFYVRAISYHTEKKTAFPRPRNAGEALLTPSEAREFLESRRAAGIASGEKKAQRLFDAMACEAPQVFKPQASK